MKAGELSGQGQEHLVRLSRARQVLVECNHALVHAANEPELLQQMCRIVVEIGGYRQVWIAVPVDDPAKSIAVAAAAGYDNDPLHVDGITWAGDGRYQGATGRVIATGQSYIARDILHDDAGRRRARALERGYQSSATLPLFAGGRCIGAISIYAREPDAFDADEIALITTLAQDISYGVEALRLRAAHEQAEIRSLAVEERFRATFEQAAVGMAHTTVEGWFLEVNRKLCEILGYSREELLALTTRDITYPDDRGSHHNSMLDLLAGKISVFSGSRRYVRKDGAVIWLNRTAALSRQAGGEQYLIQVIEDITERKRDELNLKRLLRARRVMAEVNQALARAAAESELLQETCRILAESGGYCQAWVGLAEDDAEKSIRIGAETGCERKYLEAHKGTWRADDTNQGVMGHVIATGTAHTSQNILVDNRFLRRRERAIKRGYQSAITLPLKIEGRCIGGLSIYAFEPDAFDADEITLLDELAEDLAYGIQSFRARTAHAQAEAMAQENEERFRETFNQAAVGLVHTAPLPDRRYLLVNQKFCDMVGYTAEELKRMNGLQLSHPDDLNSDRDLEQQLIKGEITTYASRKRYIRKDGGIIWVNRTVSLVRDNTGKPKYFIRVIEDITARKEVEERYRTIFDNAAVGITRVDLNGVLTDANQKFFDMLGYSKEELLGMPIKDITHPDDYGQGAQFRDQLVYGAMKAVAGEKRFVRKDGELMWGRRTMSVICDDAGKPEYLVSVVEDISDRKRAEFALRESEEKFRQMADNIPELFWIADVEMRELLYLSPVYEKVTGKPIVEVMKNPARCIEVVHPNDRRRVRAALRLLPHGDYNIKYRVVCPDGSVRWIHDQAYPVRDDAGRIYRIAGIAADITQRKVAEEKLAYLAHYDGLTGLPNRVLFRDRLEQTLAQARRRNWRVGVMMLDLDRFKVANDSLGHSVGDSLLKQVAGRLTDCVRVGDTVGRFGGDEFGIILSDLRNAEDARLVAQKALGAFAKPFQLERDEVYITASVGISMYPEDSDDLEVLIKSADTALHRAKDSGRNNFQFFTAEMNVKVLHRLSMENSLRRALERHEFLLHYQPKASLNGGHTTGLEALLRWQHPELGLVLPGEFVPLLEETGLIIPVGEWVSRVVCAQLKAWEAAGIQCVPIAINLSSRQFLTRGFGSYIRQLLDEYKVDPHLIELEITESSLMANTEDVVHTLEYLESIGVRISVDDFGTGYSSLSYLKRFPLDALKIDRSFVRDITSNAEDATIVRAIISMAGSLGLKVVAEGVETEAQMSFLATNGCDQIQGYYLSRPLTVEDCGEWLKSNVHLPRPEALRGTAPALLLVDDDEDMLVLLMRALSHDGYYILTAHSAAEAFEILSKHRVDMVISDHRMPGMSGVEFLQRVKSLYPDMARIMCSGLADFQTMTEAVNKGEIFRFLPKNTDQKRMRRDVREALSARTSVRARGDIRQSGPGGGT